MSGVHKYPTISFRISPRERDEIDAKIIASGMQKKDYFVRSCIYNRVCVVGKKEVVYRLVEELQLMQANIADVVRQFEQQEVTLSDEGLEQMRNDCLDMLKAILWMLDGAKYLWQETEENNRVCYWKCSRIISIGIMVWSVSLHCTIINARPIIISILSFLNGNCWMNQ